MRSGLFLYSLILLALAGCGPKVERLTMEPLIIRIDASGGSTVDTPDPILDEIVALQEDGACDAAIPRLQKFLEDFPESLRFGEAVVRLGMCHEERKEWEQARGYHRWAAENAHFELAYEAALHGAWCLEAMGEPALAAKEYAALASVDRAPDEARAGARLRSAINLFRAGKSGKAHTALDAGIVAYSSVPDPSAPVQSAAAEARFASAEERARAFSTIQLEYPQRRLDKRLKQKLEALVAARNSFQQVTAIKDAEWAAAAVCREGELFEEFHDALVGVPPPKSLRSPELRAEYATQVAAKAKPFLQQAFDHHVQVVSLGERVGLSSPWVTRSRDHMREIEIELKSSVVSPDDDRDLDAPLPDSP